MDKSASAIVEPQKLAATSQKSKKKPKNKKTNEKVSANSSLNGVAPVVTAAVKNGERFEVAGDTMNAANGLSEKFQQHLHIAGDGLQMNGVAVVYGDKCNSKVDSHVAQNGHHTPASVDTINNCTNASIAATKQQLSMQETSAVGTLKKSKSKNNKQNNKETNLVNCEENVSHHTRDNSNDESSLLTESMNNSTDVVDMVQLKNGFNGCVNEHANGLDFNDEQQQSVSNKDIKQNIEISPAQQTINNNKAASLAAADLAALTTNGSPDTRLQQTQSPATTAAQLHNNTTNANPPTATIKNTNNNNNTAKQDEDDVAQQAVANSKTVTTQEATITTESVLNTVATTITPALDLSNVHIEYKEYESELQMHDIMRLIQAELSEPYSIYTYRYFIYNWPKLCFLAAHGNEYVGAIVCKLDMHMNVRRGYIAMLAVRKEYRKLKIGTTLVQKAIEAMLADNADEVVLETEMRNLPALRLYENLGFVRDKRLFRYYLNGVDALRLKLWFR